MIVPCHDRRKSSVFTGFSQNYDRIISLVLNLMMGVSLLFCAPTSPKIVHNFPH